MVDLSMLTVFLLSPSLVSYTPERERASIIMIFYLPQYARSISLRVCGLGLHIVSSHALRTYVPALSQHSSASTVYL